MSAMPNGPSFSHMGIYVRDVARMEDFYKRVMGFTVTDRGDLDTPRGPVYLVFLSRDPEEHHQIVLASGRAAGEHFNVLNQMSFRVPSLAWLRALHQTLINEPGITEILPATHGNAVSLYFRDPEGTRIECFIDTPWHSEQPCREPVDFSQSEEAIMAQVERIARASKVFMPRSQWIAQMKQRMENGIHA